MRPEGLRVEPDRSQRALPLMPGERGCRCPPGVCKLRGRVRYRAPAADAAAATATATETAPIVPMAAAPVAPKCWCYHSWRPRVGGRFHEGVDIGAALGQPVYAVANRHDHRSVR